MGEQPEAQPVDWPEPTSWPAWPAATIQVWFTALQRPPKQLARLAATLTVAEQARAAQFRHPAQRAGFIVGRGVLRWLLSRYVGWPAAALRFGQNTQGKPLLVGVAAEAGVHFNLSHSAGWALYAVARCEVGVDLEPLERRVSVVPLAERICTPREWAAFQAVPAERRTQAFFRCWTRKEASAKAVGGGLASGLRHFEVCGPGLRGTDERGHWTDSQGDAWSVLNLSPAPGWMGALAARGGAWRWQGWRLQDHWFDTYQG